MPAGSQAEDAISLLTGSPFVQTPGTSPVGFKDKRCNESPFHLSCPLPAHGLKYARAHKLILTKRCPVQPSPSLRSPGARAMHCKIRLSHTFLCSPRSERACEPGSIRCVCVQKSRFKVFHFPERSACTRAVTHTHTHTSDR